MTDRMKSFLLLAAFILAFQAIGGILGSMTSGAMDAWYIPLEKSPLNPPGYVFGIAWTILYAFLAIALWLIWKSPRTEERKNTLILFSIHMIMNWAWTPVFFGAHQVLAAFILLVAIFLTAAALCRMAWDLDRRAAFLLMPYLGWLAFASYLNHYILMNN